MHDPDVTIAAISSAAGPARRGIVRVSGPAAIALAERVFTSQGAPLGECGGFTHHDGLIAPSPAGPTLPARAYLFRRPRSYTRDDLVEFHLPGCEPMLAALLDALLAGGAELAGAGEFTWRAFCSGRVDLSAASAVADVIAAADATTQRAATAAAGGLLRRRCDTIRTKLTEALALAEASIDLASEEIHPASPPELIERLDQAAGALDATLAGAVDLPDAPTMPQVVLLGRPNVGKSSLLNRLCGCERAITSARAHTTRDVIRGQCTLPGGAEIDLLDIAGLGSDTPNDLADLAGSAARAALARADAILLVTDEPGLSAEDQALLARAVESNPAAAVLELANKADLHEPADEGGPLRISAQTGQNIDVLGEKLTELLGLTMQRGGEAVGLHSRQRQALTDAGRSIAAAVQLLGGLAGLADGAELLAFELREGLAHLGAISGEVLADDVLGEIFARFCVGK
jgi:tRNA modification GTPase